MQTIDMLKRIGDIIKNQLSLSADQIYLYNQKFTIPSDLRTYYVLGLTSSKVYGSSLDYEDRGETDLTEIVNQNVQAIVTIDILSKATLPIEEQNNVLSALRGTYSQQMQHKYSFMIAMLPQNITPIIEEQGAAIPYRFNFPIVVQYARTWEKGVDSYKNFSHTILEES
jgi:hypothetical protein